MLCTFVLYCIVLIYNTYNTSLVFHCIFVYLFMYMSMYVLFYYIVNMYSCIVCNYYIVVMYGFLYFLYCMVCRYTIKQNMYAHNTIKCNTCIGTKMLYNTICMYKINTVCIQCSKIQYVCMQYFFIYIQYNIEYNTICI